MTPGRDLPVAVIASNISPNTPISYPWGFSILREVMMFAEKHLNNPRPPRAKALSH